MNIKFALPLLTCALAGCQTTPIYQGPSTASFSKVDIKATGLEPHAAYPNDMLWVDVLDGSTQASLGSLRITLNNPHAQIALDQGKSFLLRFHSVQSHFGGFSACGADVPLAVGDGERFVIDYTTRKWTCTMTASRAKGGGELIRFATIDGKIGGVQFEAKVVR